MKKSLLFVQSFMFFVLFIFTSFSGYSQGIKTVTWKGQQVLAYRDCGSVPNPDCSTPSAVNGIASVQQYNNLFFPACEIHDNLYRKAPWKKAGVANGKQISDGIFHNEMVKICFNNFKNNPIKLAECTSVANTYFLAVAESPQGKNAYNNAQAAGQTCEVISQKVYRISVKTTDKGGAGTDSNISVQLHGTFRNGVTTRLNPFISGDAFESGDLDRVSLPKQLDLGRIHSITVRHDGKFAGSDWHLDYIQVHDTKTNKWYTFQYDRWLDGKTVRLRAS